MNAHQLNLDKTTEGQIRFTIREQKQETEWTTIAWIEIPPDKVKDLLLPMLIEFTKDHTRES